MKYAKCIESYGDFIAGEKYVVVESEIDLNAEKWSVIYKKRIPE